MRVSSELRPAVRVVMLLGAAFGLVYPGALFLSDLSYPDRRGVMGTIGGLAVGYWLAAVSKNDKIRELNRQLDQIRDQIPIHQRDQASGYHVRFSAPRYSMREAPDHSRVNLRSLALGLVSSSAPQCLHFVASERTSSAQLGQRFISPLASASNSSTSVFGGIMYARSTPKGPSRNPRSAQPKVRRPRARAIGTAAIPHKTQRSKYDTPNRSGS